MKEKLIASFLQIILLFGTLLFILMVITHPGTTDIKQYDKTKVTVSGVIDRWEKRDQAVILLEESGGEIIVPKQKLPVGSQINSWLIIMLNADKAEHILIDNEKTKLERGRSLQLKQCLTRQKKE